MLEAVIIHSTRCDKVSDWNCWLECTYMHMVDKKPVIRSDGHEKLALIYGTNEGAIVAPNGDVAMRSDQTKGVLTRH